MGTQSKKLDSTSWQLERVLGQAQWTAQLTAVLGWPILLASSFRALQSGNAGLQPQWLLPVLLLRIHCPHLLPSSSIHDLFTPGIHMSHPTGGTEEQVGLKATSPGMGCPGQRPWEGWHRSPRLPCRRYGQRASQGQFVFMNSYIKEQWNRGQAVSRCVAMLRRASPSLNPVTSASCPPLGLLLWPH